MAKVERNASLTYNQLGKTDMVVSNISLGGAAFGEFNRYFFNLKLIATCQHKIYDSAQNFLPLKGNVYQPMEQSEVNKAVNLAIDSGNMKQRRSVRVLMFYVGNLLIQ